LFAVLLAYHGWALRADGRSAERSLARRHALFPVLLLVPDKEVTLPEGLVAYGSFADALVQALHRLAPGLPVALHPFSQGAPDASLSAARAVILPSELVIRPPEAIRLWLQGFSGWRIVVPTLSPGWHWVFGSGRSIDAQARRAAQVVRQMAEGEDVTPPREASAWTTVAYILAGLFLALLGFILVTFVLSIFLD
jgi:hypothetical protein